MVANSTLETPSSKPRTISFYGKMVVMIAFLSTLLSPNKVYYTLRVEELHLPARSQSRVKQFSEANESSKTIDTVLYMPLELFEKCKFLQQTLGLFGYF